MHPANQSLEEWVRLLQAPRENNTLPRVNIEIDDVSERPRLTDRIDSVLLTSQDDEGGTFVTEYIQLQGAVLPCSSRWCR